MSGKTFHKVEQRITFMKTCSFTNLFVNCNAHPHVDGQYEEEQSLFPILKISHVQVCYYQLYAFIVKHIFFYVKVIIEIYIYSNGYSLQMRKAIKFLYKLKWGKALSY